MIIDFFRDYSKPAFFRRSLQITKKSRSKHPWLPISTGLFFSLHFEVFLNFNRPF
jgi:hypothetical protein